MSNNAPGHNHYAPQFYLRAFACDEQSMKVPTVTKHGERAVWKTSSIEYVGAAADLYTVHIDGAPHSVERRINSEIEAPISKSATWDKILAGRSDQLTAEDKPVIYALMRHLELRTPHAKRTMEELIEQCKADPSRFSAEEREMYTALGASADLRALFFAHQSSSLEWAWETYSRAALTICRTDVPLRTSSVPILAIRAPDHPGLHLPLPGQVPYTLTMTLNPNSFACLTLGTFEGEMFQNVKVEGDVARSYNRHRVAQFAHFEENRHLISSQTDLREDMEWAGYHVELDRPDKLTFCRP